VRTKSRNQFAKYEDNPAKAQRANKARRVQAIHAKTATTRKDFLHRRGSPTPSA
jgi:hypothetical protein